VKALPDYKLWIKYADGVEGVLDLTHLVGKGIFALWEDYTAFQAVYIGSSGDIAWGEQIDICPEEVFPNLTKVEISYA
jgi:hypothetical protein